MKVQLQRCLLPLLMTKDAPSNVSSVNSHTPIWIPYVHSTPGELAIVVSLRNHILSLITLLRSNTTPEFISNTRVTK